MKLSRQSSGSGVETGSGSITGSGVGLETVIGLVGPVAVPEGLETVIGLVDVWNNFKLNLCGLYICLNTLLSILTTQTLY